VKNDSTSNESRASRLFIKAISIAGLTIFGYALYELVRGGLSIEWLLLSIVTILVVSRTDIKVPKITNSVTLDDAFVYISLFLYGVPSSVVLAGLNGAVCSLHYVNRRKTIAFNTAVTSLSVYLSGTLVTLLFGDPTAIKNDVGSLILAAETLALAHYILNAGLVSLVNALRRGEKLVKTWSEAVLWTSIPHFAGAVAACIVVKLIDSISFYSIIIPVPILAITYLTYKNYLDKVRTSVNHVQEMSELHLRTIEALAIAIDAKDEVTHDHVHRVQVYATGLAKLFGLSEAEIEALQAGALMHDIGKLAVPDYILNKPGKLTEAEYDKMKIHTVVGAEILSRVGFPYPVVPVVRHHHERWDGRGYPDGLKGKQIPITARILMVVDCFDAVREDRQYRKAMTREEAVELLQSSAGTMYDPKVVEVFLKHLDEFEEEIRRRRLGMPSDRARQTSLIPARAGDVASAQGVFEQIRNAHREVITLYEIAQTIGTSLDLRDMFALFSSRLQDIVSYTTCVLYLHRPNSIELDAAHVAGRQPERFKGHSIVLGAGITGWVAASRQAMYNSDPRLDFEAMSVEVDANYRSAISVPLTKDDEILGALTLYSTEQASYRPDDLRLVEAVAKLASDAIANALHHEQTEANALTDQLTGVPNARALRHRFEEESDLARRHGQVFSLLMMDLDGFKKINDTLGHQAGDVAICEVATTLSRQIRASDFLSRYAGDEFVAILHATSTEIRELVCRIQQSTDDHDFSFNGSGLHIGISVGWATFGVDGHSLDELLLAADRSMYADKFRRKALPARVGNARKATVSCNPVM
jgi:diguanylate cyclase (GGDEF)-like protein/putative nucleotidyltransferase with HDIG domain